MKLNINNFALFMIITIGIIVISSCSEQKKGESVYSIDSTLIGERVTEGNLNIQYNPPEHWISANAGLKKITNRKIKYGEVTFVPVNLFYNASNKAVLNIGKIIPNNSSSKFDLKTYIYQSTKRFAKGDIERDNFEKKGVTFIRLEITFGVWFTYRIIFKNKQGKFIQFDYSLQSKYKKEEQPAIVSSVGSIRLL